MIKSDGLDGVVTYFVNPERRSDPLAVLGLMLASNKDLLARVDAREEKTSGS